MTRLDENEHNLTDKQEAFVLKFVECRNASEAYRHAYDVGENTSPNTVRWEAWELQQNPNITQRIADLQAAAARSVMFGVADAYNELEDARKQARSDHANGAEVSSVKAKIELFGLGSKHLKVTGTVASTGNTEQESLDILSANMPLLKVMLAKLGFQIVPLEVS